MHNAYRQETIMHTRINWFEIPSADFQRATTFYETLFATELKVEDTGPVKMAIFFTMPPAMVAAASRSSSITGRAPTAP
ncbi:VOC family protein [Undibacterium arcticum]